MDNNNNNGSEGSYSLINDIVLGSYDLTDVVASDSLSNFVDTQDKQSWYKEFAFFTNEFDEINSLDIKNFDYTGFSINVKELEVDEANRFFDNEMLPIFQTIEEEFLFLNYDSLNILSFDTNTSKSDLAKNKKDMILNIIKFFMVTFPYTYLRNLINSKNLSDLNSENNIITYLDNDEGNHDLKLDLINEIEKHNMQLKNLGTVISKNIQTRKESKENNIDEGKRSNFDNLNKSFNEVARFNQYFIMCIERTETDNLTNLIKKYIENDLKNINVD